MSELFDIEKFNLISDDENYYFFRSLEPGDIQDIENATITTEEGYSRLRTDRERWEESHSGSEPRWNGDSTVSLEEMYSHIKIHYSLQTNCISLSSNANVVRTYGDTFSDRYVMIKVPKKEMGEKVFHAGQYMLDEIQKRVEEFILNNEIEESVAEDLEKIENANNSEEIKELIKVRYRAEEPIDTSKTGLKRGIAYRSPHARVSSYQSLDEEQTLEKNKIIAKLTILEHKGIMPPIMPRAKNNNLLIQTVGSAFASSEQIYYGDIEGERVQNISKEVLDMFGLLQQIEGQENSTLVEELKRELIKFAQEGRNLEIPENSVLRRNDTVRDNISIKDMYELTNGRVEYGSANSVVKNMFYMAKSRIQAAELSQVLNQITGNNPRYKEVIESIEKNSFEIEPEISTRRSNIGVQLSESVNINLKDSEIGLVEEIKNLTEEEQIEILENGGVSNVREIMTRTFSKIQTQEEISKERYYAEAIISLYNWRDIGIDSFSTKQKEQLIQKLQEKNVIKIYDKLKEIGIEEKNIATYVFNIASISDLVDYIDYPNFGELVKQREEVFSKKLSIDQIETFLGYHNLEGTEIVLRDYQRSAKEKADKIYETKRFAQIVLPTGGGKSFVALAELLEHKDEPLLYLAPSNEILEQMKDYIIEYVHGEKGTLGNKSKDQIIAEIFPDITFTTYQNLHAQIKKGNEEIINKNYGFIALDEDHRVGAKEWEKDVEKLIERQPETTKVLGITATPIRDVDNKNMADELARKLGYTEEEIKNREHIAMNMDLIEAIKLGLVVNPKVVSCEYTLLEEISEKINSIADETVKKEKMQQYEALRRNLGKAKGIPQILQENIKPGGKYLVFVPITGEIEDEDGNRIGKATGKDKILACEKDLQDYLKETGITPKFYSMLGAYTDRKNEEQLEGFENDNSEETKFMLVINKADEGLHIKGLNGMIWFRALDENSNIKYTQELGRVISSEDPNNPTKEEDRPVVIDIANNTLRVNMEKQIRTNTSRSDLELLETIVDWSLEHESLPDIESSSKQEQRYAATLYRIQNSYMKYIEGFEEDANLTEKKIEEIEAILNKGSEIDLWDIELPPIPPKELEKKITVDAFEITGVLRDLVELSNSVGEINTWDIQYNLLKWLKEAKVEYLGLTEEQVRKEQEKLRENGGITKRLKLKDGEQEYNIGEWVKRQKKMLNKHRGKTKEEIEKDETIEPEEKRRVLALLELGINPTEERKLTPEETWDIQYNLLKGLKEAEGEYLGLTSKQVKEEQKKLRENGGITKSLKLKDGEQEYKIGIWIMTQKQMLNKHRGKTKEEIEKDEKIKPEEKRRVLALLKLGISLTEEKKLTPEETWNIQYNLLKGLKEAEGEYLGLTSEQVKKEQEKLEKDGNVFQKLKLKDGEQEYNIGIWVNTQKQMLNKYRGKTKEEIEQDEKIKPEEKRRVLALLKLGITFTEERWEIQYNLLKGLKEAEGEYLGLISEQVKKEQENIENNGSISHSLKLKDGEQEYQIGEWVHNQKRLLNKYRGKIKEEIEQDEKIEPEEKRRVLALLDLGIRIEDVKTQEWNKNYDLLKGLKEAEREYLGLTSKQVKEEQEKLKKNGSITGSLKLKDGEQEYNIGRWVSSRKQMLNKYRGKTKEEIEQDEKIEPEEKRRVLALLELGISPTEEKKLTTEETWDIQYNLLKGLKEAEGEYLGLTSEQVKKEQEKLEKDGSVTVRLKLKNGEQEYNIYQWVNTQKQMLNKHRGKTKEEIEQDEKIKPEEKRRVLALLKLGITFIEERWEIKYNLLKGLKEAEGEYLGLISEQVKKEQENIEDNGSISRSLKLKDGEQEYNIGKWVSSQKQMLNKYRGKTKEEIEQDEKIKPEEKRRVLALLELGIQPTKLSRNDIGKAGLGANEEECRKAEEDLAHRVEQIEKNKGGIIQNG